MDCGYVYILTNDRNNVLYTGSTTKLKERIYLHKKRLIPGFTKKYNVHKLVYYEFHNEKKSAFDREQKIKNSPRKRKILLIESNNKKWEDLYRCLKQTGSYYANLRRAMTVKL